MSEENEVERKIETNSNFYKVSIIGLNELGSTTAFLLISRQIVTDLILIDRNSKRLAGSNRIFLMKKKKTKRFP